jgi:hypothetical protein
VAPAALTVVHDIPGRLRLRLPAGAMSAGLAEAIGQLSGVMSSTWSDRTRGLLVQYDPERVTARSIVDAVSVRADVDIDDAPRSASLNGAKPKIAAAVAEVVEEMDARVVRATGGVAGLGIVVSMGLALWAATEIVRGRVAPLAWSSALWYAHGLFRDYHPRETR